MPEAGKIVYQTPQITTSKATGLLPPKEKYEPFTPIAKKSRIGKEFGIENHSGTLNCFVNVCLQSLWQCPRVRQELLFFCDVRDGGPPAIKPFINAI